MLLDTGSGCASPLSIDGVAFGVGTWSTSRELMVQVGQTVLDRYKFPLRMVSSDWVARALVPSVPLVSAPERRPPVPVSIRKEPLS